MDICSLSVCVLSVCLFVCYLSVCLFVYYLSVCLSVCYLSVCLSVCYLSVCLSVCYLSVCLSVCLCAISLSVCVLSVCLSVCYLSVCLSACYLSVCLSVCLCAICLSVCVLIWQNGDFLEQWANNRCLFKRYSKLLYTIAKGISPYDLSVWLSVCLSVCLCAICLSILISTLCIFTERVAEFRERPPHGGAEEHEPGVGPRGSPGPPGHHRRKPGHHGQVHRRKIILRQQSVLPTNNSFCVKVNSHQNDIGTELFQNCFRLVKMKLGTIGITLSHSQNGSQSKASPFQFEIGVNEP